MTVVWERLDMGARQHPEQALLVEAESGRTLTYRQPLSAVSTVRQALGASPCTRRRQSRRGARGDGYCSLSEEGHRG